MVASQFAHNPPPPHTARPVETGLSAGAWGTAAKVTVGLTMAASVGTAVASFVFAQAWNGYNDGTTDFSDLLATETVYGVVGLLYLAIQIAAYVAVITWLYKAAKNAERINPGRMNNSAKWAIWGWFVPFMNLARPYHMVKETWEASNRGDTTPTPEGLFKTWWALVLIPGVLFRFTFNADTADSIVTALYADIVANILYVAAGVLFIKIIGMIEQRQANATLLPNAYPAPAALPNYVLAEADQIIS